MGSRHNLNEAQKQNKTYHGIGRGTGEEGRDGGTEEDGNRR